MMKCVETTCSSCSRPMVLRVGVDLDDAELAVLARSVRSLARRVECERCRLARTAPVPIIEARVSCGRVVHRGCPDDE